ncbi:hypothetical protein AMK59_1958 [Oryctes borbonicus]|uniref:Ion channel n=1 Tax=Oryctes borbonicus TaxID=1629725 RepID=A0A0T6BG03_9SCAR|nr:hypothetical protein AMK59_1958 [Oryctes borbonicus]
MKLFPLSSPPLSRCTLRIPTITSRCTNMYEPVSDGCVTVVVAPKHSPIAHHHHHDQNQRHQQQQQQHQQEQSDADDESAATTPVNNNNNLTSTGTNAPLNPDSHKEQTSFQDQRSPRRLPRRKKNRAPTVAKHESLDLNNCQKVASNMRTGSGDKCIDIDHITLERNYKNKKLNVATQTSHVVPYRLKFWPKLTGTLKCGEDARALEHVACCCRTLSQWCLSQVGLALILVCWALLGAFAFYQTEGPREQEQSKELQRLQNELTVDLSTNLRQASTHEESWPKTIQKYLTRHETLVLEAVSAGYGEGGGGRIWTYPGCILFAVSLLTTLGIRSN